MRIISALFINCNEYFVNFTAPTKKFAVVHKNSSSYGLSQAVESAICLCISMNFFPYAEGRSLRPPICRRHDRQSGAAAFPGCAVGDPENAIFPRKTYRFRPKARRDRRYTPLQAGPDSYGTNGSVSRRADYCLCGPPAPLQKMNGPHAIFTFFRTHSFSPKKKVIQNLCFSTYSAKKPLIPHDKNKRWGKRIMSFSAYPFQAF